MIVGLDDYILGLMILGLDANTHKCICVYYCLMIFVAPCSAWVNALLIASMCM